MLTRQEYTDAVADILKRVFPAAKIERDIAIGNQMPIDMLIRHDKERVAIITKFLVAGRPMIHPGDFDRTVDYLYAIPIPAILIWGGDGWPQHVVKYFNKSPICAEYQYNKSADAFQTILDLCIL